MKYLIKMWEKQGEIAAPVNSPVSCFKFSPSGQQFCAAFAEGTLCVFDTNSSSLLTKIKAHTKGINQVKWSRDGSIIISCSDDGNINCYRSRDLAKISECKGHHSYVFSCDISPSNIRIASGSYDESIRIWETSTGKNLHMISAHNDPVSSVVFNSDGSFVISSSWDGFVRIFETFSGLCVKSVNLEGVPISHLEISPNDGYVLVSLLQSKIKLISLRDQKLKVMYRGHDNLNFAAYAGFIYRENRVEVFSGTENTGAIGWDMDSGEPMWSIPIEGFPSIAVDAHPTGNLFLTACGEGGKNIALWKRNAETDPQPVTLPPPLPQYTYSKPPKPTKKQIQNLKEAAELGDLDAAKTLEDIMKNMENTKFDSDSSSDD